MILTLYCAPKCIIDLNIKTQIARLWEENIAENLFDLEVDRNFLEKQLCDTKSLNDFKNDKLNFIKIKDTLLFKDTI